MNVIQFNSDVTSQFEQLLSTLGGVQLHSGSHWKLASSQAFTGASSLSLQIPVRERSTKMLLTTLHDQTKHNARGNFSISGKTARVMTEYQLKLAGMGFPVTPVTLSKTRQGGALKEIQKALGTTQNPQLATMLVDGDGSDAGVLASRTYYPATDIGCAFAIVSPLSVETNNGLETGLDTSNQSSNFSLDCKITAATSTTTIANTWSNSDAIFTLTSSGTILVSS